MFLTANYDKQNSETSQMTKKLSKWIQVVLLCQAHYPKLLGISFMLNKLPSKYWFYGLLPEKISNNWIAKGLGGIAEWYITTFDAAQVVALAFSFIIHGYFLKYWLKVLM